MFVHFASFNIHTSRHLSGDTLVEKQCYRVWTIEFKVSTTILGQ